MSISSLVVKETFQGTGSNDTFAVPFVPVASDTEIVVYERDETDADVPVETLLVVSTDYTLTGASPPGTPFSTSVVLNSPLALTSKLIIKSGLANTQPTDIDGNKSISENALEKSLDRAVRQIQQLEEQLTRVPKLPVTEQQSVASMELPEGALNPSTVLGYDSSGDLVATVLTDLDVTTSLASQAEAEAGTENTKYMSPLRVEQHYDSKLASQAVAEAGTDNETHLSPLRGSQQLTALYPTLDFKHSMSPYNLGLSASVGSSALTIALRQADGSTSATAAAPVTIPFRSSTITSGAILHRKVSAALSMVVSSGSTLGHTSAKTEYIFVYAIDNAGTVELAVSSALYNDGDVVSTTAEGGAGAADSATAIYSTTARSGVGLRLIGRMKSVQTTAGTWAAVPTVVGQMSSRRYTLGSRQVFTADGTWTRPDGCLAVEVMVLAGGGAGASADGGSSTASCSGGGGAGGRAIKFIKVGLGATETITVGAAGAAAAAGNNAGGAGGTSSFGSHCSATGGAGGLSLGASSSAGLRAGGAGGTGSGGDINIPGMPGLSGYRDSGTVTASGSGASTPFGAGGRGGTGTQSDGDPASGYGAGGAGGASITTTDQTGGAGVPGLIIVEEYY